MKFNRSIVVRAVVLISLMASLTVLSSKLKADTGDCGGVTITLPFTDVTGNAFFCQIAAAYFSGLTNGTTATTYSPADNVTREQMAAFTTRTLDQTLKRGSQRAVTKKWWTPQDESSLTLTNVGTSTYLAEFDGTDLWVANNGPSSVMRIRPSDGKVLDTWTGASNPTSLLAAMGRIFIPGVLVPGRLYMIDPTQPAGAVTTLTENLGDYPQGIAFDGERILVTNPTGGRVSLWKAADLTPLGFVSTGADTGPYGACSDGLNFWITLGSTHKLARF
jgi:hypothetical protein